MIITWIAAFIGSVIGVSILYLPRMFEQYTVKRDAKKKYKPGLLFKVKETLLLGSQGSNIDQNNKIEAGNIFMILSCEYYNITIPGSYDFGVYGATIPKYKFTVVHNMKKVTFSLDNKYARNILERVH